ncbi:MAG TPA: chloride channel protein [Thermoplasmata archaeon]|nr:chloride channel protein [Thermoplasmata archaeon]
MTPATEDDSTDSAGNGTGWSKTVGWLRHPSLGGARSLYRWALIGITVGVIAGLVAVALFEALNFMIYDVLGWAVGLHLPEIGSPPTAPFSWSTDPSRFFILPVLMIAGALAVGLLIWKAAPEIEGHGTDQTIRAFHRGRGVVRYRVPPLKFIASVLTIGTGGSGGREGPTAQIGSGLGSFLARPLGLSTQERRVAMMAGVGAGIGAIFKAPFGAALLSSEVLYLSDFEPEVIMPSIMASVISYSIFGAFDGFGPEFATPGIGWIPEQLPVFALLGAIAGLLGILYVVTFYSTRDFFQRIGLPKWARPAVGVAVVGVLFLALYYLLPYENHLLAVGGIGIGYGVVQWLLFQGHLAVVVLVLIVALIFVKMVATALTVGSGGSAGLFGPAIVIGALVGFSVVSFIDLAFPSVANPGDVTAFTVIGMMAFFGSVSKAPIATIVMVVEMTGSEALLVPAMIAIFIGYYVAGPYHLYEEQVENRLASPAHTTEYFAEFLRHMPVTSALQRDVATDAPTSSVADAMFRLSASNAPVLAVVEHERLIGEVRLADILGIPPGTREATLVRAITRESFPAVRSSATLLDAVGLMDAEGVEAVLVTDAAEPHRLAGVVTREAIYRFQRAPSSGASANGSGAG